MIIKTTRINTALVFFLLLLFCIIFLFFTSHSKIFIVLSGSMMPMMIPGDMIITNTVNPVNLEVGDVIAFQDPHGKSNTVVTHRIISINNSSESRNFQTKGDANGGSDIFLVPESNIIGKLAFVLPFVGYLPGFLKNNPIIYILLIMIPALLLIFNEIKNIIDYSNSIRARKIEKLNKKAIQKTLHVINEKKIVKIMLISGIILSSFIIPNTRINDQTIIEQNGTIHNSGYFPIVYISTSNDYTKHWYGVVASANETLVEKSENTGNIISVPYFLPVYWLLIMMKINPYFPMIAEICLYTLLITFISLPLWYKKITIGTKFRKFKHLGR